MPLSPRQINVFLFFKLPAAFFCGVRLKSLEKTSCTTTVKHRWINQNPFGSLFWAVQGMAAELSTGALIMAVIKGNGLPVSMLVIGNKAHFSKKAKGRITFICKDGLLAAQSVQKAIETGEGQIMTMLSEGTNEQGDVVSVFEFEWSVRGKG